MKKLLFIIILFVFSWNTIHSQEKKRYPDVYPVTSGEFIFCNGDVEMNGENQETKMRFSFFFHYGQYWHVDLNNNFGFYSGGAIRNVGLKTKNEGDYNKVIRRSYSLGMPFAFKLGSFDDHFFVFGGAECEWMFHYKQKFFNDNGKNKTSEWFSDRTNPFAPSVFAGIQFPKGLNLKFKYYLDDFLNKDYTGSDFGQTVNYSTYKTRMFYISISFDFKTKEIIKKKDSVLADLN
ncbi:MAG: hypothetical protein JXB49_01735 [Bacteroidales bacterium]|nr:hypothetical protein [Bacteroidales bacterium]